MNTTIIEISPVDLHELLEIAQQAIHKAHPGRDKGPPLFYKALELQNVVLGQLPEESEISDTFTQTELWLMAAAVLARKYPAEMVRLIKVSAKVLNEEKDV